MNSIRCIAAAVSLFAIAIPGDAQETGKPARLAEGNSGIASQYPGDAGIALHRSVVFVENFNDSLQAIQSRWDAVKAGRNLSISADVPFSREGDSSLLVSHTGGRGDGSHLWSVILAKASRKASGCLTSFFPARGAKVSAGVTCATTENYWRFRKKVIPLKVSNGDPIRT